MTDQPTSASAGHVSPDGKWLWDGPQWVPNAPVLVASPGYVVQAAPGGMVVAPKNPTVQGAQRWNARHGILS